MQRLISMCTANLFCFFKRYELFLYDSLVPNGNRLSDLQVFNAGIYELVNRLGVKVKQ